MSRGTYEADLADAASKIPQPFKDAWRKVDAYVEKHGRLPLTLEEQERAQMLKTLRGQNE
jgi:hypothetical protein